LSESAHLSGIAGADPAVTPVQQAQENDPGQDQTRSDAPFAEGQLRHESPRDPRAESPSPAQTDKAMRSGEETLSSATFIARSRSGST
jgi:hypothetical protein